MHLAILMTNTDESAFADAHPRDGAKFTNMIRSVRPDWTTEVFAVKDGIFPGDLARFDGVMITGSPASVNDGDDWTARLLDLIRAMVAKGVPIFGACYGHQAVAKALGGSVGANTGGFVHGLNRNDVIDRMTWMDGLPDSLHLYASHKEQVTVPPAEARVLTRSEAAPVTGMAIGTKVYTTQHHPEMSRDFIAALTGEMVDTLGPEATAAALRSLASPADGQPFAESVARFFEQAAG